MVQMDSLKSRGVRWQVRCDVDPEVISPEVTYVRVISGEVKAMDPENSLGSIDYADTQRVLCEPLEAVPESAESALVVRHGQAWMATYRVGGHGKSHARGPSSARRGWPPTGSVATAEITRRAV